MKSRLPQINTSDASADKSAQCCIITPAQSIHLKLPVGSLAHQGRVAETQAVRIGR